MIRKFRIDELKTGMYVSGFQKEESDKALFFMNNLLVKNEKELEEFYDYGYRSAYVVVEDTPETAETPPCSESPAKGPEQNPQECEPIEESEAVEECEAVEESEPEEECGDGKDSGPIPLKVGLTCLGTTAPEDEDPAASYSQEKPAHDHIRLIENPEESGSDDAQDVREEAVTADTVEYREEIQQASVVRDGAETLVREFMADKHGELKPEKVHKNVEKMVDSIFRNRDALSSLVRLKSADDYTFTHCVNVSILSMSLGRQMGFGKNTVHDLGVGAILHDIGKTCVPVKILKKPGPLSAREFEEMRKHSVLGGELLLDTKNIKDESRHVVLQHHEKYNGTGYPGRKEGHRIHVFARIAAVADVYDAMTSNRVYQKSLPPDIALQKMYMLREVHFEPSIVERLIKCLGIYPIGTLVELNTGEVAVVTSTNPNNPVKPGILVLFDEDKKRMPKPVEVKLASETSRWVVESKAPETFGIDIEDIIA
jgi:HD-GYP domain-containing protein (c-di-GMP phosphodiesterase class II)